MIPNIEQFKQAMQKCRGNISQVAKGFGVTRSTVYRWMDVNPDFKVCFNDSRGEFLDEVISTARIVALGIPMKDADGNFVGYQMPPDGSMLRYLLGTLGRNEGFGEHIEADLNVKGNVTSMTPQEAKELLAKLEQEY